MTAAEKTHAVRLIGHYLSLHGLIADTGAAEREAATHIQRGLDEAEYIAQALRIANSYMAWPKMLDGGPRGSGR